MIKNYIVEMDFSRNCYLKILPVKLFLTKPARKTDGFDGDPSCLILVVALVECFN